MTSLCSPRALVPSNDTMTGHDTLPTRCKQALSCDAGKSVRKCQTTV